ncbi:hypothetical protein M8C21_022798 [Ambrosia artemisiifolia]|uniref:Uncharacterized protein n=1 Tax=Ambrosia artemisiifolia TaxID=4212 RepID=A0AAD5G4J6_AMBAR|nr:hypothetical protein M8C21_022798 [Ambrosia artemisiifolia]
MCCHWYVKSLSNGSFLFAVESRLVRSFVGVKGTFPRIMGFVCYLDVDRSWEVLSLHGMHMWKGTCHVDNDSSSDGDGSMSYNLAERRQGKRQGMRVESAIMDTTGVRTRMDTTGQELGLVVAGMGSMIWVRAFKFISGADMDTTGEITLTWFKYGSVHGAWNHHEHKVRMTRPFVQFETETQKRYGPKLETSTLSNSPEYLPSRTTLLHI